MFCEDTQLTWEAWMLKIFMLGESRNMRGLFLATHEYHDPGK